VPEDDILVVIHDPPMDDWSVGGVPASEVDVGFKVDI
jgi:phenylpyruvate tautomerase PptA (4-oxalocrotonate tautomerase family)